MSKEHQLKDGVESNNMQVPAFTKKYLDEELEETGDERINVRLNSEDRKVLDELKDLLAIGSDGAILKQGLRVYKNVIIQSLGVDLARKLCSGDRRRPTPKELRQK